MAAPVASLGNTLIHLLLFVVNIIICTGAPGMTMCPPEDPTDASGVVVTADALDGALPPVEPACFFGGLLKLLISEVAVCCING